MLFKSGQNVSNHQQNPEILPLDLYIVWVIPPSQYLEDHPI